MNLGAFCSQSRQRTHFDINAAISQTDAPRDDLKLEKPVTIRGSAKKLHKHDRQSAQLAV
jgi:hypothetical protein